MNDDFDYGTETGSSTGPVDLKTAGIAAVVLALSVFLAANLTRTAVLEGQVVSEEAAEAEESEGDEDSEKASGDSSEPGLPLVPLAGIVLVGAAVLGVALKSGGAGAGGSDSEISSVLSAINRGDLRLDGHSTGTAGQIRGGLEGVRTLVRSVLSSSDVDCLSFAAPGWSRCTQLTVYPAKRAAACSGPRNSTSRTSRSATPPDT